MVEVNYSWEDDHVAGVSQIKCDCGHIDKYVNTVSDESTWTCDKCGRKIKFIWKGMEEELLNGPTKTA